MQREIKFRGKRIDNGEWVYGSLIQEPHRTRIFTVRDEKSSSMHEVDPETVGQYIGSNDENEIEIWEDDFINGIDHDSKYGRTYKASLITYKNGEFGIDGQLGGHLGIKHLSEIEVIGNIYENPNLLTN